MKRSLITAGCIFLLAVTALPVFVCYINHGKNEIVITQEVVEGNPEAAAGIVLQMENTWNNNLFWDTEYVIGSGEPAESNFTFYAGKTDWNQPGNTPDKCMIRNTLTYFYGSGYGRDGLNPDAVPVPDTVRELVRQTNPKEVNITLLSMKDSYEYWPVSVELTSSNHEFFSYVEYGMSEFFKIPVPEEAKIEITVQKDADDRCTRLQCEAKSSVIDIKSTGAFGSEGCYLAYYCVDAQNGDLMPPGENYGIYYVPYSDGAEQIRKVFSLEKDCMPVALETDEETGLLWILILQNGEYYLDLLDFKDEGFCELVQQIPMPDTETDEKMPSWVRMSLTEQGLLITWLKEGLFAFISESPEEGYVLWCVNHFPGEDKQNENTVFPYEQAFLFDGERLALAAYPDWISNDIQLAVFTEEGLAYYGLYRHSGEWDRENNIPTGWIHPVGVLDTSDVRRTDNPLKLRFF